MPVKDSLYFSYDGIMSADMGIENVNFSTGLLEEPFLPERTINEIRVRGNSKPYLQDVEEMPLVINLSFAFQDTWDEGKIREVARWLRQEYYKPLYFSDNPNRIFYCMYIGSPTLLHNGLKQGFINLTMRCDSPYAYSPVYISSVYDLSANPVEGTVIQFENAGDLPIYPEISIEKVGAGDVEFYNQTNGNRYCKFTGLSDLEELYIHGEKEIIETSVPDTYRYENFTGQFMEMVYGMNDILIKGNCRIEFRWQNKLLQG